MTPNDAIVVRGLDSALVASAVELAKPSRSEATERAYAADWGAWGAFCADFGLPVMPTTDEAIVAFLAHLQREGARHSSISRAYATIRARHRDAGRPLPTSEAVRNALQNIGRVIGTAPEGKAPLMAETLKTVVRAYDDDASDERKPAGVRVLAVRDAGLLLVTFAAALRRSDVVARDVSDIRFTEDGISVFINRSKTDQLGAGETVGVPFGSSRATCPVRALRRWLDLAGIVEGPLFRAVDRGGRIGRQRLAPAAVDRAAKRAAERAGLDPALYGAHSLRSGLATSAAKAGKGLDVVMRTGRWKSERVARGYIRHGTVFDRTASEGLL